ncbi:XRE family transcriptional regulator [bacterium 1xD42-67]|nr:XRE family transcriptional regulator [bacterium 1xD42-67]
MDNLLKEMGKRISTRRKELRLTQEELAEKAGVTSQTISTAETGVKALRPWNIVKLCETLEISADYLLFGKVSDMDLGIMMKNISGLPSEQYRYLESIVNSFLAAVKVVNNSKDDSKTDQTQ